MKIHFFKQIIADVATDWIATKIEINIHVFAKSARVVISVRFGVSEAFQNAICLDQDIFNADKIN